MPLHALYLALSPPQKRIADSVTVGQVKAIAALGRIAYFLAWPFLFTAAHTVGKRRVRVMLKAPDGSLLLVRTSVGRQLWALPGGGIARNESTGYACVREVEEETGLKIDERQLTHVRNFTGEDGFPFEIAVYSTSVMSKEVPQLYGLHRLEIMERNWFSRDEILAMPNLISSTIKQLLS